MYVPVQIVDKTRTANSMIDGSQRKQIFNVRRLRSTDTTAVRPGIVYRNSGKSIAIVGKVPNYRWTRS